MPTLPPTAATTALVRENEAEQITLSQNQADDYKTAQDVYLNLHRLRSFLRCKSQLNLDDSNAPSSNSNASSEEQGGGGQSSSNVKFRLQEVTVECLRDLVRILRLAVDSLLPKQGTLLKCSDVTTQLQLSTKHDSSSGDDAFLRLLEHQVAVQYVKDLLSKVSWWILRTAPRGRRIACCNALRWDALVPTPGADTTPTASQQQQEEAQQQHQHQGFTADGQQAQAAVAAH